MTYVLKAGVINRPLPAFRDAAGGRWEYDCGWCDKKFEKAKALVAHVKEERAHGTHQPR